MATKAYKVIYDYSAFYAEEMSVNVNEVVRVSHTDEFNWCTAYLEGKYGLVPSAHLMAIVICFLFVSHLNRRRLNFRRKTLIQ